MKTMFKWLSRALFVIVPTLFMLIILYKDATRTFHPYSVPVLTMISIVDTYANDFPFLLLCISIILNWFSKTQKFSKPITIVASALFLINIIFSIFTFTFSFYPIPLPTLLPTLFETFSLVFVAVFCLLPNKFVKTKWILIVLCVLMIILHPIRYEQPSQMSTEYIIGAVIFVLYPKISLLLYKQIQKEG